VNTSLAATSPDRILNASEADRGRQDPIHPYGQSGKHPLSYEDHFSAQQLPRLWILQSNGGDLVGFS